MKLAGEHRSIRRKNCPSATLSTTNPTWSDLISYAGFRGAKSATNRLNQATARGAAGVGHEEFCKCVLVE